MTDFFTAFADQMTTPDRIERLRAGLIGDGLTLPGPDGPRPLIYADYTASGRALRQVEDAVMTHVLPYYANSHTEGSYCGALMTRLRREARTVIARHCGADDSIATIFTGAGATAGINRAVHLLGLPEMVAAGTKPLVVHGPYEHHSNILPWRETGAEVIEIEEAPGGGVDLAHLEQVLNAASGRPVIGTFSATSNISGILTDTAAVTHLLKRHGALAVWDYAGGAPYIGIDMAPGTDHAMDVVVFSPHKFIGGPAASGVLMIRRDAVQGARPTWPGGGTVRFVSPWGHDYATSLEMREEAGTPNVIGDIRAALAVLVKEAMGQDWLDRRHAALRARAEQAFAAMPGARFAGQSCAPGTRALPILSFWLTGANAPHFGDVTRILSDRYGIQTRSGCACAGPYGHRLLGLSRADSDAIRTRISAGDDTARPGFTRFNLSALLCDDKVDAILSAVAEIAATSPVRLAELA